MPNKMQPFNINRDIKTDLDLWAAASDRKPLLLRGARQVGKSFVVKEWAVQRVTKERYFEINLEEQPRFRELFKRSLDPSDILRELNLVSGFQFSENSILFIDEIQASPEALLSLRFFYEKRPEIKVIAAGSLLEFVLDQVSFPVGRITSLHLYPLSFAEFIAAIRGPQFRRTFDSLEIEKPVPQLLHEELNLLLSLYFRIGGMPKAVRAYLNENDISHVAIEQQEIVQGYLNDLAKYSKKVSWEALESIFSRFPTFVMHSNINLSKLGDGLKSDKVKAALKLFEMTQLVSKVSSSQARKAPLEALSDSKRSKYAFLDIGLLQNALGFDWSKYSTSSELSNLYDGVFAEQFVAQEFLANSARNRKSKLHYWDRDVKGSEAEVDFLIEKHGQIVPVEVKNSPRGRLKSLHQYLKETGFSESYILCQRNFEQHDGLRWVPLYLAGKLIQSTPPTATPPHPALP